MPTLPGNPWIPRGTRIVNTAATTRASARPTRNNVQVLGLSVPRLTITSRIGWDAFGASLFELCREAAASKRFSGQPPEAHEVEPRHRVAFDEFEGEQKDHS